MNDYPYIRAYGRYFAIPEEEIESLLEQARKDKAPQDSFKFSERGWLVVTGGLKRQLDKLI